MKSVNCFHACGLLMCILIPLTTSHTGQAQWEETAQLTYNAMDDEMYGAGQHSLVLDNQGYCHLIWFAGSDYLMHQIFYATNASGSWVPTQLTNTSLYNRWPSLAVDNMDAIHAVWMYSFKLTYATNQNGDWETSSIAPSYLAYCSSIALDSNRNVHIAFANPYPGLVYTTNESGEWILEDIALGLSNEWPTLGIDPSDGVHVAWLRGETEEDFQVFYATNGSGQWLITQLTSSSVGTQSPSLDIDQSGFIHIAWTQEVDDTTAQLFYATNASGHWETAQITDSQGLKYTPSLAVDPFGYIHIAWTGDTGTSNHIVYTNNINGFWITDRVPTSDSTCMYPNIAVDTDTSVHIAYCSTADGGDLDIFYVKHFGPNVAIEESRTFQTPTSFHLCQNYPNPFNAATTIHYTIPSREHRAMGEEKSVRPSHFPLHIKLKIYNILGREVRTLVDEAKETGFYTVGWDGRDAFGQQVPSGVYFYRLNAGVYMGTKSMLLIQ